MCGACLSSTQFYDLAEKDSTFKLEYEEYIMKRILLGLSVVMMTCMGTALPAPIELLNMNYKNLTQTICGLSIRNIVDKIKASACYNNCILCNSAGLALLNGRSCYNNLSESEREGYCIQICAELVSERLYGLSEGNAQSCLGRLLQIYN